MDNPPIAVVKLFKSTSPFTDLQCDVTSSALCVKDRNAMETVNRVDDDRPDAQHVSQLDSCTGLCSPTAVWSSKSLDKFARLQQALRDGIGPLTDDDDRASTLANDTSSTVSLKAVGICKSLTSSTFNNHSQKNHIPSTELPDLEESAAITELKNSNILKAKGMNRVSEILEGLDMPLVLTGPSTKFNEAHQKNISLIGQMLKKFGSVQENKNWRNGRKQDCMQPSKLSTRSRTCSKYPPQLFCQPRMLDVITISDSEDNDDLQVVHSACPNTPTVKHQATIDGYLIKNNRHTDLKHNDQEVIVIDDETLSPVRHLAPKNNLPCINDYQRLSQNNFRADNQDKRRNSEEFDSRLSGSDCVKTSDSNLALKRKFSSKETYSKKLQYNAFEDKRVIDVNCDTFSSISTGKESKDGVISNCIKGQTEQFEKPSNTIKQVLTSKHFEKHVNPSLNTTNHSGYSDYNGVNTLMKQEIAPRTPFVISGLSEEAEITDKENIENNELNTFETSSVLPDLNSVAPVVDVCITEETDDFIDSRDEHRHEDDSDEDDDYEDGDGKCFDSLLESVILLMCDSEKDLIVSQGLQMIINFTTTLTKPSSTLISKVISIMTKSTNVRIAQGCYTVLCHIQRFHSLWCKLDLWNLIETSCCCLKDCKNPETTTANVLFLKFIARVIEDDVSRPMSRKCDRKTKTLASRFRLLFMSTIVEICYELLNFNFVFLFLGLISF